MLNILRNQSIRNEKKAHKQQKQQKKHKKRLTVLECNHIAHTHWETEKWNQVITWWLTEISI